jgi:hypothetical protein
MNIARERAAIDEALDSYRKQLDTIPDELFTVTPPDGGWSYAEIYSHIMQATLGAVLTVERCTHESCRPSAKGPNFLGHIVLLLGMLPVKVKVPEKVAAKMPALKISKEEARNLIIKCRKRMDDITPLVNTSLSENRFKHPRLGMFNAAQWLRFIGIHLRHHLKQIKRTEKKL